MNTQWAKSWGNVYLAANENALTQLKFELGICSLHENGVDFCQNCNGNTKCNFSINREIIINLFFKITGIMQNDKLLEKI